MCITPTSFRAVLPDSPLTATNFNNQKYLITEFGDSLFYGASKLNVTVRNNPLIERIGAYSFYGSGLTSMGIPATCTEIGKYAFVNARNLNELVLLSNSVPTFSDAFYGANNTGFKCYVNWAHYASYKRKSTIGPHLAPIPIYPSTASMLTSAATTLPKPSASPIPWIGTLRAWKPIR